MIVAALLFTLLAGCGSDNRLDLVDSVLLSQEAQILMERAKQRDKTNNPTGHFSEAYELPQSEWTPMIKQVNPKQVRYSVEGVWLIDFKWVSKENGFFIPPKGTLYTNDGIKLPVALRELKPGIYSYHNE